MLKVECESCKAPYQIDERRVPPAGLKMRCPKCGHSFVVKSPNAPAAAAPPAAPVAPPAPPKAAAPPPAPPRPPPPKPAVVPARPPAPSAPAFDDIDLPAPVADLPAPVHARPAGPAIQRRAGASTMLGVPAPAAPRVVKASPSASAARPDFELDLPSLPGQPGAPKDDLFADLPAPVGDLPALAPNRGADLPALPSRGADLPALAPNRPPPRPPAAAPPLGDLPAVAPKRPAIKQTSPFGDRPDLPSVSRPKAPPPAQPKDDLFADLPSAALTDLPSPANIGLPAPAHVGLPAAAHVGLPSTGRVLPPSAQSPAAPARRGAVAFGEIDLPVAANDLPAVASSLPAVANALPAVANALPAVANSLPLVANTLPTVQETRQQLPSIPAAFGGAGMSASLPPAFGGGGDDFGELELPRAPVDPPPQVSGNALFDENPFTSVAPPQQAAEGDDGGFGELELPVPPENKPASFPPMGTGMAAPMSDRGHAGGMSFGELDLGGGDSPEMDGGGGHDAFGEASLGSVIQPPPQPMHGEVSRVSQLGHIPEDPPAGAEAFGGPSEATIDSGAKRNRREREDSRPKGPSPLPKIMAGLLAVIVVGGSALQLTPFGAFGSHVFSDALHKNEYAALAANALTTLHDGMKEDVFSQSEATANKLAAARAATPRARTLTAVAAIAEFETELRFGKNPERANRAKLWLTSDMPEPRTNVTYLDVATAGAQAVDRDNDKARAGFEAAARKYANDPIAQDIAFMAGQLALRAGDGATATAAFTRALALSPGARAHFGLAQAAFVSGDQKTASNELDATIKASPKHGAALIVRAQMAWGAGRDDASADAALKDIATLLEGPAKDSISTQDQAEAYALRGNIQFARGRTVEARAAFADALKVDARNVSALVGQGDVFYDEGRYTEAVGRYDTAKGVDGNALRAIVGNAKTLIALERMADAKTELLDAVKRFPKSPLAMRWLGICVAALGDRKEAEKDFLAAIALVNPKDPEAIDSYAAYASFLAADGRADEAQAKLTEAQKRLPDTAALERTLGDVAEVQGHHLEAIARYHAALAADAMDVTSRFRLGQALRRNNQIDEASKVFDLVYAADKNYPGLSLERGVLFEQSGHVEEALAQFQKALEKAPNDPDLTLRVGEALVAIGKPEDALPKLKDVLKQRPNSAEAEHYIGRAYMLEGGVHQVEAMRHLRTAAEKDPNHAEYHLYVGWLANDSAPPELGLAAKEIKRALELDQTLADAYWQRGVLELATGANDDAIKDLHYALQLKPTRFEAHASLAQVYEQKNQPDQAIAEWNIAFARDDGNELWNYKFGKLLLANGRYAEAAKHLKAATEAAESEQPRPGWLAGAEFPAAEALRKSGDKAGAIAHYNTFLQHADSNDPNNRDARRALKDLGAPYQDDDR